MAELRALISVLICLLAGAHCTRGKISPIRSSAAHRRDQSASNGVASQIKSRMHQTAVLWPSLFVDQPTSQLLDENLLAQIA
jgi:hypothetical protein